LEQQLAAVDADPTSVTALRAWVRDILIGDDVEMDAQVEPLILAVVERLDLASGNDTELIEVARQLHALLRGVEDEELAKALVPLAQDRANIMDVLRKAVKGQVSRTGWLSYVAEQHWSAPVKKALAVLDGPRLTHLLNALVHADYKTVATVLDLRS